MTGPTNWRYDLRAEGEPLRELTADALTDPATAPTAERLRWLDRPPYAVRWESPGDDDLRDRAAALRRETLADLPSHLGRLQVRLEDLGVQVHRAATAAEALDIITDIARAENARVVAKAKSMVTEEIGLNAHFEAAGIEVIETDLGEHIIQRRHERPSQLITPALHLSAGDVAELFDRLDADEGRETAADNSPDALAARARHRLRADFARADMGVTGVNFAAADTGTLALLSNEGNIDMVTTHPRVHVAVMGIEKVIPRLADVGLLLPLLSRAGGDREVTAYQTLLTGPRRPGETDGPEVMHVVMLDNGRSRMLDTPVWEALACIRCGNCQMVCPVFKALGGGHAYGSVYGGPIGSVISPMLGTDGDTRIHADLPYLSTLCGACADACPVRIPLPELLLELRMRDREGARGGSDDVERAGWGAWSRLWSRRRGYRATVEAARLAGRFAPRGLLARMPLASNWATGRALPDIAKAGVFRRDAAAESAGVARGERAPLPLIPVTQRRGASAQPSGVAEAGPSGGPAAPSPESRTTTEQFVAAARDARADVVVVDDLASAHVRIRELIGDATVVTDSHPDLDALFGARAGSPDVWGASYGVSLAVAGAAATGTVAVTTAPGRPRSTGITPENHIVLLRAADLVATYDDLVGVATSGEIPSTVRLTTGPSRSGDIELQSVYGMHGPRTLTVVLVSDSSG
ncbi:MAG: LUD domain-containing protein [Dermatophilus congolensis]|nr:LUD domain-containing protein [Dermatophilus congolensis]